MKKASLRTRMSVVFGLLIAGVAAFMVGFFPSRMEDQALASAELRAWTVAGVMAKAAAPALEFDDSENATKVLGALANMPDAKFATIVTENGTQFASWNMEDAPAYLPGPNGVVVADGQLVVGAPVIGRNDGRGILYFSLSLDSMVAERDEARGIVGRASLVVFAIGLVACIVLATALVRPLRRLTITADEIARGKRPPRIATVAGGHEVEQMTSALGTMLERLNDANGQLVQASRMAGMAEVATGVLHNVGNILTSVNVALELANERVGALPVDRMRRVRELLEQARTANGGIEPAKLEIALKYLTAIADHIGGEKTGVLAELGTLRGHIDHIKRVVAMQNAYARTGTVDELVELPMLVDEAIALGCADPQRHGIVLACDVQPAVEVATDRHRVLQILVNLIHNARDSVTQNAQANPEAKKHIAIAASTDDDWLEVSVTDSGIGFAPELQRKIFSAGFTTKPKGHGYGLHSSALAADQLGGTLSCSSPGPGLGASFVLRVPAKSRRDSRQILPTNERSNEPKANR